MPPWKSTPLFEEIREAVKLRSKAEDVRALTAWLVTHYEDAGTIRNPKMSMRKKIVIDDIEYWLVRTRVE